MPLRGSSKSRIRTTTSGDGGLREPLATPAEVADHLGESLGQLANRRYRGTGPAYVTLGGRSIRYRWSDVDAWLEANTRTQTG